MRVNANIAGVIEFFLILSGLWAVLVIFSRCVLRASLHGDIETGLALCVVRLYARVYHGLRVRGKEHIPRRGSGGPLIVVSNHTAGVDPLLIQSVVGFEIRWVMAEDMRLPWLDDFWDWGGVIFVDRQKPSTKPVRAAIGHLRSGGVLGLFPDAQIERPPRVLLPFHAGVGAFVRQTGARVLPVVIEGTPSRARSAWASLFIPSRAVVRVLPVIDYTGTRRPAAEIAEDLRRRYGEWTGWPAAEAVPAYAPAQNP